MTKVLYLSFDGLTDPLGQSQILPYLCGLSNNFSITIISFEKQERYQKGKDQIKRICEKHNLVWEPLTYHRTPPVFCTLYDLIVLRKKATVLHKQHQFKIVHCRSYVTSLIGLSLKQKFNIKFIFDMRGFWADERVDGGLWNLKNPIYKLIYSFFKRREIQFLNEADQIISLTENAKNEILSWGIKSSVSVIPCCVDLDLFNPETIDRDRQLILKERLGIHQEDYVLLYLGSLGTWYLVDQMLLFFSALRKKMPAAKFLIVTPDKLNIENYPHRKDIIVVSSSRNEVPQYISLANASIVFIKASFSKKASSATKLAEIMAMGKRQLVNTGWGDVSLYESTLAGIFTISSSGDYDKAIDWLSHTVDQDQIRKDAHHYFALDAGVEVYTKIYDSLINQHALKDEG